MRIQYASDLHLDMHPKTTYEEILKPGVAPVLALLGDVCPLDYSHLYAFFEWCSERWATVIWIPGNLEVWGSGFIDTAVAVHTMKKKVDAFKNVHVLCCEAMGSEDGLLILGCPLWRRPSDELMLQVTGNIWAKSDPTPVDKGVFLMEYNRCKKWLQSYLQGSEYPVVVLSHYAPLPWLTEEEWIPDKRARTNAPDMEILLRRPLVAWLFGHCHVPVNENYTWTDTTGHNHNHKVLLTSNPGAPKMDAVVRVDPRLYLY